MGMGEPTEVRWDPFRLLSRPSGPGSPAPSLSCSKSNGCNGLQVFSFSYGFFLHSGYSMLSSGLASVLHVAGQAQSFGGTMSNYAVTVAGGDCC